MVLGERGPLVVISYRKESLTNTYPFLLATHFRFFSDENMQFLYTFLHLFFI